MLLLPLFDSLEHLDSQTDFNYLDKKYHLPDIYKSIVFLQAYKGSKGTFNSYRREIERLLHWSTLFAKKNLTQLKREDIEKFVEFCQKPPKSWIGTTKPARFVECEGLRRPNNKWRPFVSGVSKRDHRQGLEPSTDNFALSNSSVRELLAILSSFFAYLVQEEYILSNPVALIRQKSKFIRHTQNTQIIRRLSNVQWQYVIEVTKKQAACDSNNERSLFILSALYSMYLRISELTVTKRWRPAMNHFFRDSDDNWWFVTVGKGNKERHIAVSETMLLALKRWRTYLGYSALPTPADNNPLLPKFKGKDGISSTNTIRILVQKCFDNATLQLRQDKLNDEADALEEATVHWLRHTGISEDVKIRPREHVRDDAGHSSGAITDRYIDIERKARHRSAKNKVITQP